MLKGVPLFASRAGICTSNNAAMHCHSAQQRDSPKAREHIYSNLHTSEWPLESHCSSHNLQHCVNTAHWHFCSDGRRQGLPSNSCSNHSLALEFKTTSLHPRRAASLPAWPSAESPPAVCACSSACKPPGSGCTAPWGSPGASSPGAEPAAHRPWGTRRPLRQTHWTGAAAAQRATRDLQGHTELLWLVWILKKPTKVSSEIVWF